MPPQFLCPIFGEIMDDPVSTVAGHVYERAAIANWLRAHNTDPVTNTVLASKELVPNIALRQLIQEYVEANPSL